MQVPDECMVLDVHIVSLICVLVLVADHVGLQGLLLVGIGGGGREGLLTNGSAWVIKEREGSSALTVSSLQRVAPKV